MTEPNEEHADSGALEKVDELMAVGYAAVQKQEFDRALEIGNKLRSLRHSSAFEILALAYERKGDLKKAIEVLEEGVSKVPSVWMLWQLLGNYYSDDERYKESAECYGKALGCDDVDECSVNFNTAMMLDRSGRKQEALQLVDKVDSEKIIWHVLALKVGILNHFEEHEKVIALTGDFVNNKHGIDVTDETDLYKLCAYSDITVARGLAEFKSGDEEFAGALARRATHYTPGHGGALWLLREIDNAVSPDSLCYLVLVEGMDCDEQLAFIRKYEVVADSEWEVLEYIKRLEGAETADSIEIMEVETMPVESGTPKGVYFQGLVHMYDPDAEDEVEDE